MQPNFFRRHVIVWDECTIAHKIAFEATGKNLQDIRENNKFMGGVIFLLFGDFRLTLPFLSRGTAADE